MITILHLERSLTMVIIDESGQKVQHINEKKGLQNNTILGLFPDRAGNIWLGLITGLIM